MFRLKNFVAAVAVSVVSVGAAGASTLVSGVFNVRAVNVTNLSSSESAATIDNFNAAWAGTLGNPASDANPSVFTSDTFKFQGSLNFSVEGSQTADQRIDRWLDTAGGTVTDLDATFAERQLSYPDIGTGSATTTFFFFELFGALTEGDFAVRHDDGFAIFDDGTRVGGVNGPIGITNSAVNGEFDGGTFGLLYVATNGNPSVLQVHTTAQPAPVPVPAALPMLLAAMGGLGWMARRRRAAA
jgi:hypothetical protein